MASVSPSSSPGQTPSTEWKRVRSKLRCGDVQHDVKIIKTRRGDTLDQNLLLRVKKTTSGKLETNVPLLDAIAKDLNKSKVVLKALDEDEVVIKNVKVGSHNFTIEITRTPAPPLPPKKGSTENRPPMPDFKPQKPEGAK